MDIQEKIKEDQINFAQREGSSQPETTKEPDHPRDESQTNEEDVPPQDDNLQTTQEEGQETTDLKQENNEEEPQESIQKQDQIQEQEESPKEDLGINEMQDISSEVQQQDLKVEQVEEAEVGREESKQDENGVLDQPQEDGGNQEEELNPLQEEQIQEDQKVENENNDPREPLNPEENPISSPEHQNNDDSRQIQEESKENEVQESQIADQREQTENSPRKKKKVVKISQTPRQEEAKIQEYRPMKEVIDEIVESMSAFPNQELLISFFRQLAVSENVPIETLNLTSAFDKLAEKLETSTLDQREKMELIKKGNTVKTLIQQIQENEKKEFRGAFPRYHWLTIKLFVKKIKETDVNISDMENRLSQINIEAKGIEDADNWRTIQATQFKQRAQKKMEEADISIVKLEKELGELASYQIAKAETLKEINTERDVEIRKQMAYVENLEKLEEACKQNRGLQEQLMSERYAEELKLAEITTVSEKLNEKFEKEPRGRKHSVILEELQNIFNRITVNEEQIKQPKQEFIDCLERERRIKEEFGVYEKGQKEIIQDLEGQVEEAAKINREILLANKGIEEDISERKRQENNQVVDEKLFKRIEKEEQEKLKKFEELKREKENYEVETADYKNKIQLLREKIEKEKKEINQMVEESKIGEGEFLSLELELKERTTKYEQRRVALELKNQEDKKQLEYLQEQEREIEWKRNERNAQGFFKKFLPTFFITIIVFYLLFFVYMLPSGSVTRLIEL